MIYIERRDDAVLCEVVLFCMLAVGDHSIGWILHSQSWMKMVLRERMSFAEV